MQQYVLSFFLAAGLAWLLSRDLWTSLTLVGRACLVAAVLCIMIFGQLVAAQFGIPAVIGMAAASLFLVALAEGPRPLSRLFIPELRLLADARELSRRIAGWRASVATPAERREIMTVLNRRERWRTPATSAYLDRSYREIELGSSARPIADDELNLLARATRAAEIDLWGDPPWDDAVVRRRVVERSAAGGKKPPSSA